MKTNYVPAIVMLVAGGVYCLLGIFYQIPLWDFTIQLLTVLVIFWIIGGIIKIVFDKYMGEIETPEEETEEESEEGEENSKDDEEASEDAETEDEE